MSYADATAFAASLATTLMVSIVVFQAGDGTHSAMPADEFDGDEDQDEPDVTLNVLGAGNSTVVMTDGRVGQVVATDTLNSIETVTFDTNSDESTDE